MNSWSNTALQAMTLTEGDKMLLTPTDHLFDMCQVHQDATLVPLDLQTEDHMQRGVLTLSAGAN